MTPYERNLDFWRQLWRCVERSDAPRSTSAAYVRSAVADPRARQVLVQILDARDPEFYRCRDLERYIEQFPDKRHLLLLNKAWAFSARDDWS